MIIYSDGTLFFIYCNLILYEIKNNNDINNIKSISKISEKLIYLDEYDKVSGFWKYIFR